MKNFIWNRDIQESMNNPYEYEAQEQFLREALTVIKKLRKELLHNNKFYLDEKSLRKAIFMLIINSLDSCKEILENLSHKKHRVAAHLLRTIDESIDLAEYFNSETTEAKSDLMKWFQNEIIPHRKFRDLIKKTKSFEEFENHKKYYQQISNFNHNTYETLLYSYALSNNGEIVHEGKYESDTLIPVSTIAMYHSITAQYVLHITYKIAELGFIDPTNSLKILSESQEVNMVKRRYQLKQKKR